jgi:putative DNA primase/helicase
MNHSLAHPPLSYALAYARRGWRVFPLHSVYCGDCSCGKDNCSSAGKHPRTKNGVLDATTDFAQIRAWWEHWPMANVGIATGNGLLVGDFDFAKGANPDDLAPYGLAHLTDTLAVLTGSKGWHYYWDTPEKLPNSANKIGPFIDTRGDGGYVVAPPSFNKNGQYEWLVPSATIANITPELLAFLKNTTMKNEKRPKFFTTI